MASRNVISARTTIPLTSMGILLLALGNWGCAAIARSMARGIAETSIERDLTLPRASAADLLACVERRGGACPQGQSPSATMSVTPLDTSMPLPGGLASGSDALMATVGVGMAAEVLNHPVQRKINDFYNYLRGVQPSALVPSFRETRPALRLDMREIDDYMMDIEAATLADGWSALAAGPATPNLPGADRRRAFLKEYFTAYFRSGQFYQFNLNPNGLAQRVKEQLKKSQALLDDDQIDALVEKILEEQFHLEKDASGEYKSVPLFGTLGTNGFVTRGGASYSFPSIEAQLDPAAEQPLKISKIDFTNVGADLLRVLLHAIFDANDGLPCVSNATGLGVEADPLAVNTPGEAGHLSADDFGRVEEFASRIEGASGTLVGRAVRGVAWIALNNEALAVLIETTVGVVARKVTEKAVWCWYSCGFGETFAAQPAMSTAPPARVRLIVTGPAALIESREPWTPH